jgi:hypothetical protein
MQKANSKKVNNKNVTKHGMYSPDLGAGTVAAVIHTAVFQNYMRGGKFISHQKDYHIFPQG